MSGMVKSGLVIIMVFGLGNLFAQYAPAAGLPGSTTIHKDSSVFVAWATGCEVARGPINILDPDGEKHLLEFLLRQSVMQRAIR